MRGVWLSTLFSTAAFGCLGDAGDRAFGIGDETGGSSNCTLIGCASGLQVTLEGESVDLGVANWRLEVTSPQGNVSCVDGEDVVTGQFSCSSTFGAFLVSENFMPESATFTALRNDEVVWGPQDRALTFREFQPNGPGCDPTCISASVIVDLGEVE